jgi:signal peptidase II
LAVAIGVVGVVADYFTKLAALTWLNGAQPIELLGGVVILRLLRNPGAAFSMGESFTPVFGVFAIIALVAVVLWLLPRVRHLGWAVACGFLLAGITGNLLDRLFREPAPFFGHVIDFIQVPYFAVFNVADMFITGAAILIIWFSVVRQVSPSGVRRPPAETGADADADLAAPEQSGAAAGPDPDLAAPAPDAPAPEAQDA